MDLQTGGQFPMCRKSLSYTPSSVWGFCPERKKKKTNPFTKLFPNSAALNNLQRSCDAQDFSTLTESGLRPPGALSPSLPFPHDLPSHIVSSCDFIDFIFFPSFGGGQGINCYFNIMLSRYPKNRIWKFLKLESFYSPG